MKICVFILFVSLISVAASNEKKRILPVTKEQEIVKKNKIPEKIKSIIKDDEDCDKKAKEKVEIKPESISLTGNTGCSIDEAQ